MSELSYEASDEASENELLERSLSVWRGWSNIREDFTPIPLDIHTASSIGQYECVRSLITRGAVEIDRKNVGGWTPLMYACYIGHDHIVSLLIDAGCNVNLKNQRGQTPLMLAASCGNESVGRILLRKGAELEAADCNGWTALFHATYSGHQNFVSFLLDQHANMDAMELSTGITPFMEAASEGHEIIVQLFLQHGVNVNAKSYNGDTARSLALICGYMKIVSLIDNHVLPHSALRSEPGLDDYLSSSDEVDRQQRPMHHRSSRARSKGPNIRDGPEAIARMIDRTRAADQVHYQNLIVPRGYLSFPHGEGEYGDTQLSYRDVTSPINQEDYVLDSSGGKDSFDYNDDSNAFSKTGAITIKSSSSSSGGLIAALGLSRQNSADSDPVWLHDSGVHNSSQSDDSEDPSPGSHHLGGMSRSTQGSPENPSCKSSSQDLKSDRVCGAVKSDTTDGSCKSAGVSTDSAAQTEMGGSRMPQGPALNQEWINKGLTSQPDVEVSSGDESQEKFSIQFGDVVFPDVLQHVVGDSCNVPNLTNPHPSIDNSYGTKNGTHSTPLGAVGVQWSNSPDGLRSKMPDVGVLAPAPDALSCFQFSDLTPRLIHMQRRSSCQAHLLRPTNPVEQDISSGSSEGKLRRRSANSPPNFHGDSVAVFQRDFLSYAQDAGCVPGRWNEVPTSAGAVAGYVVATSSPLSSPFVPLASIPDSREDKRSILQMASLATVASTSLVPSLTSVTSQTSSTICQHPGSHRGEEASISCFLPISDTPGSVTRHMHGPAVDEVKGGHSAHCDASSALSNMLAVRRELPSGDDGGEVMGQCCGLEAVLEQLGLGKYAPIFSEQDVDLQVFLSLTDNDLKEIGIKLFGPRKKMTNAIARWHSQAPAARSSLEQAYADRLEGEMQELAIQLNQAYDSMEKLRAQVMQEQQLRSVTESCLMEERAGWQHMHHKLMDARRHCSQLSDTLSRLTSCQAEMKERLDRSSLSSPEIVSNKDIKDSRSELCGLPYQQLSGLTDQYIQDLHQHHDAVMHSIESLLSLPPAASLVSHDRHVGHEFP